MNVFIDRPNVILSDADSLRRIRALPDTALLADAIEYCVRIAGRWCIDGKVFVRPIDPDFNDTDRLMPNVYKQIGFNGLPESVGYTLSEEDGDELWQLFRQRPVFAAEIAERLSRSVFKGWELSPTMQLTISAILSGHLIQAKGRKKRQNMLHRDTLLVGIAKRVHFVQRGPEPHGTVPDGQLGGIHSPAFEAEQNLASR